MGNFVGTSKLVPIKEIVELWDVELQRVKCSCYRTVPSGIWKIFS